MRASLGRNRGYTDPPDSPLGGTQVRVWDTRTGDLIATLDHTNTVLALLWHPSGRLLVTDDFTEVSLWDPETWTRKQFATMSGGDSMAGVRYHWTRDGGILVRGHHNCSLGGDSLNFLDMTTLQQFGTIDCSGNRPYEWSEPLGGIPSVSVQCESTTSDDGERCRIHVSVLLLEPQSEKPLGRFHSYEFGQFARHPETLASPDNSEIVVVTDRALQFWRLEADSAALLWSGEPAANVAWSSDGDALALINDDAIRIVTVESGAERVTITNVQPNVSKVEWSQDDAFILVWTEAGSVVFDAASGAQMPLPDGVEYAYWESGFLRFRHPADGEFVWWSVRTEHVAFGDDHLPTVVSGDDQFGAEARSGVLRVWSLTE